MTTNEIRSKFLEFFKSKGHTVVASDSVVPKDDPTVLFTTAGMQQFKPQFLGRDLTYRRASTCQKCLRTDDLDVVGKTDFHHTFFEMLGNFSFGDYFKKEAIAWAWEFLTQWLKLPKEKLWVSVYKDDDEAYNIWLTDIKIPMDKIVRLGDKSNFWPSNARLNGPNGPCGPCSEIFYDYGVNPKCPNGSKCDPDCSCGRFSEIWNLVFTQFNRKDGGILDPLPAKNIDTGMGLERLAAVVQGKKSNYETDNFRKIIEMIDIYSGANSVNLTVEEKRIIADHMRAIVFAIADGIVPSNKERGSVVKKLINTVADITLRKTQTVFGHFLVPTVVDIMQKAYPDLGYEDKQKEIVGYVRASEEDYKKIFVIEIPRFKEHVLKIKNADWTRSKQNKEIGNLTFYVRDTLGLSLTTIQSVLDRTAVFAQDRSEVMEVFEKLMQEQRERSRAGSKMTGDVFGDGGFKLDVPKTEFLGYDDLSARARVLKIMQEGQRVKVILDQTPFYAQAGGQVGDRGYIRSDNNTVVFVTDTQKINDVYIHDGVLQQGLLKEGDAVNVQVDKPRRLAIMRNHSSTHLLQSALREILGAHVKQQGSLVDENRLRFDFTHPQGVKPEEIQKIENRVNQFIQKADKVTVEVLPIEEAKKKGALAFFAEKYGDKVRVVTMGDYSREFCGGTHLTSTDQAEAFKIVSEGSVAQGIRRVEAVTGKNAVGEVLKDKQRQEESKLQAERAKQMEKEQQNVRFEVIKNSVDDIINSGEVYKGSKIITHSIENADMGMLRKLSDIMKQKNKSAVLILGAYNDKEAYVIISATDDLVDRGIRVNELIGQVASVLQGSGGGRPQMAQAGSKDPQKLEAALEKAKELVKKTL